MIEAAKRGTKYGAMTLGITDRPDSPMAKECRKVLKMDIPLMGEGVGASSYVSTSTTMLHPGRTYRPCARHCLRGTGKGHSEQPCGLL